MNTKSFRKMVVLAVALVCVSAGYARADKAELQEKLSKDVKIQLSDVTIAEALEEIGEKAGVKFVLSDEAAWKMPQGEATRLSVVLDGPLAESMTEMLNVFFIRYAVGDEEITIYPRPELEHILGRPTAKQLELLKDIYTKPIQVYFLNEVQKSINAALGQEILVSPLEVQRQLHSLLRKLAGEKTVRTRDAQGRALTVTRMPGGDLAEPPKEYNLPSSVTLVQLLRDVKFDVETAQWYIPQVGFPGQVPEIRVVSEEEFREAKLDQIVDISFTDERAEAIIQRLANWTGMQLIIDKQTTSWLDAEMISVDMQNVKLQQALLNIVSSVNGTISIYVDRNEIFVRGPKFKKPLPRATTATRSPSTRAKASSEGYVGKISIPMEGGKYYIEFMLHEKDLTEELKKLREEKMREILGEKESKPKVKKKSSD